MTGLISESTPRKWNTSCVRGYRSSSVPCCYVRGLMNECTCNPNPRCSVWKLCALLIMRNGTPFCARVRASVRPAGPAPACANDKCVLVN